MCFFHNKTQNQPIWLCNEQKLALTLFGQLEAGALSWGKAVQGGVRADKVVEDEHGNEIVCRSKGRKALFGLVPCLELFVETRYEVVGNVIVEALHADVLNPMQRLDRHLIGEVTVTHDGLRRA